MAQIDKTVEDPFTRRKCTPKMVTKVSSFRSSTFCRDFDWFVNLSDS